MTWLGAATFGIGSIMGLGYVLEAAQYPIGTLASPGPGLYPLVVGAVIFISLLGILLESRRAEGQEGFEFPDREELVRVTSAIFLFVLYIILVDYLGHAITAALISYPLLRLMGQRNQLMTIGCALAAGVGSNILFRVLLGVQLPVLNW